MTRKTAKGALSLDPLMLGFAYEALRRVRASAILVFIDPESPLDAIASFRYPKRLVLVTREKAGPLDPALVKKVRAVVRVPEVRLTRVGRMKLSVIISLAEGAIKPLDRVVCLVGPACAPQAEGHSVDRACSQALDCMMVIDLAKETDIFTSVELSKDLFGIVRPEVLETALAVALALANEGREGRAVGTTFVLGDHERVLNLSRPLVMNPFKGYSESLRNILDTSMHETIKEYALMDGAFVISGDGVVMAAGVHLDAALDDALSIPGLGCRHMSAAGITDVTRAISVTVSGSTGIVRVFRGGKVILEFERQTASSGAL